MSREMTGKVILVTGANSGIGKAAAESLAGMGATLVMLVRSRERGETARMEIIKQTGNEDIHLLICDLSSQQSVLEAAHEFRDRFNRLDVLVNNAGIFLMRRETTADGLEKTFAVNHMGYFLLADLLLDLLVASAPARVVNVSSDAHRVDTVTLDDLQREKKYSGFPVYGESKLMNVMFTYALARRLEGTGVTVNAMHPGFVRSNFARSSTGLLGKLLMPLIQLFGRTPEKGAETVVYLASALELTGLTGKYYVDCEAVDSSPYSYDERAQEQLWQASLDAVVVPELETELAETLE